MSDRPKVLCLYSGGLDSAGALWALLNDPNYIAYDILVHHTHIINFTKRALAEQQSINATLPLFEKHTGRKLYRSSTVMDFSFIKFPAVLPTDADVLAFVVGNLVNIDTNIKFITVGKTADDVIGGGDALVKVVERSRAVFHALALNRELPSRAQYIFPVENMSKQQIWSMLPAQIRNLTWSCRMPVYKNSVEYGLIAIACGRCATCLKRKKLS